MSKLYEEMKKIIKRVMLGQATKDDIKEYMKLQIETLEKEASEEDIYIGSPFLDDGAKEWAKELGYEYVLKECEICGKKVWVINVRTKARILCPECAIRLDRKGG